MKSSKRKISLAVALVITGFGAVAAAQAAPLLGGGSTLVQPTITTEGAGGVLTYFGVGSGLGQSAFLNNAAADFTSVTSPGVTITASGTVDFANSDAALTPAQISGYTRAGTDGALIQIPYIVTPITIPLVHAPTGTGPALDKDPTNTPTVALNDADLCGIFSGQFTDWSQVTNPDNGSKYASGAITVVYRSDNSGTTDLLTSHLAKVCPIPSGTTAKPVTFVETQNFASLFPASQPPANFVAASGSGGVAASLLALSGAGVSYLSPDWTNTALAPSSAPAQANQLKVASLRNTHSDADVIPTAANATAALGSFTAPTGANASSPANWVPIVSDPASGYPISGTSQIIVSQCYANPGNATPSVASQVTTFLTNHYQSNAAIVNGNGFDVLPTAFKNTLVADFLSTRSALGIGNATACAGIAGR
jgi:phosphate transport system substrate-binding protein